MAPNAKIMALRVANESGGFLTSAVLGAYSYMKKAAQARVNLVAANNSWMGAGESPLLTEVMDDLYRSNGVLSVFASGNYAADLDQSLNLPAGAPTDGAIAVNAVDRGGQAGFLLRLRRRGHRSGGSGHGHPVHGSSGPGDS